MRVIDEEGKNAGILKLEDAIARAAAKGLDLIEIAPTAHPPVARIISFDKFRYQKEKEEKKQRLAQRGKELKQVRISPRSAENDLRIKAHQAEVFLNEGHKVEISIFLRGREKRNKEWGLQKLREFLPMVSVPYIITMEPRAGGRGFITQIIKK